MGWKEAVGKIAPVLGLALTGNLPGAAAAAIGTIADALGLDSKTPEAIEAAVRGMTPEQALLLKKVDHDFALSQIEEMNRAAEESERIAAMDRSNARDMAKTEIGADKSPWWAPTRRTWLSLLAVVGFFSSLGVMFYISIKEIEIGESTALQLGALIGSLGTIVATVYNFDFGSTQSSHKKDDIISRSMPPKE